MAPTPDQYQAALQALRDDAQQWQSCSDDLKAAKTTAEGLDLTALHLTYIGDKLGLTTLYNEFQDKMVRLLGEGETVTAGVSAALLASAQTYQDEEEAGVHRMNNIW